MSGRAAAPPQTIGALRRDAVAPAEDLRRPAGEPAAAARRTLLVYRHRLAPRSEVGFLRRFYLGFEHLTPVWLGCHLEAGADALGDPKLRLGRTGPLGALDRALFRHCGVLPPAPDLRAQRPLLLHAHFGRGGALALPIARALAIPLVVTFHGGDAGKERHYRRHHLVPPVYQRRLAALQHEAALFVCVSQFVREQLAMRGFPGEKLVVIRQGVELDVPPPAAPPEFHEPYVLFVGRFVAKKGLADLIAAMRLLAARDAAPRLVVIGDGPLAGSLRQAAQGLPVVFAGWRPEAEVRQAMRHASVVCVPSLTAPGGDAEGLPSVVLEAMAEAAAIVATRHAGIAEAIEHGHSGLLVPEGDPTALAAALEHMLAQPAARARLGAAARAAAVERFDTLQQSRLLERALLRVAGEAAD